MHLPSVSVVICCFNYERYVGQAIESVLSQTAKACEIIVVDDGSRDGSAARVASYGPQVRLIRQENLGHVQAVNRGYQDAVGEVVIFLDADDALLPNAIASVQRVWRPEVAKVQFELQIMDADGQVLPRHFCNYPPGYNTAAIDSDFKHSATYLGPVLSGNAYARWYLDRLMPLTVPRAPDGVFNTVAPLFGPCVVLPETLGLYRLHGANQSTQGEGLATIGKRFEKRIALRLSELDILQRMASSMDLALPGGKLLNRDLIFVNYRLMLKKLGHPYPGHEQDSVAELLTAALAIIVRRPMRLKLRVINLAWFMTLAVTPRAWALALIGLRFERAGLFTRLKTAA